RPCATRHDDLPIGTFEGCPQWAAENRPDRGQPEEAIQMTAASPTPAQQPNESQSRWRTFTAILIGAATAFRLLIISTTQVADGEAYYYVWSRFPSWSYYDHPPLVAWMAWLTTRFSHSSLALRIGPVLCAALFGVLLYRLGEKLFSPRAGFIAVLIITAMPV